MPKKTNKYNSVCEADIHTNMPQVFVLHVARCKICQEKLPKELLEALEPNLSKNIENIAKREAETGKGASLAQPAKDKEKVSAQPGLVETKPKETVSKLPLVKPDQPADDLDAKIRGLPTIRGLAKTIEKIDQSLGLILGMGGVAAGDAGKEGKVAKAPTGEVVTGVPVQVPEVKPGPGPAAGGERVSLPEESLREAEDIKKDLGGDSYVSPGTEGTKERVSMREGEVKEEPVIPPTQEDKPGTPSRMAGVPDLESPEQIAAMEQYLTQQKKKLGMGEGGGVEAPAEKGKLSLLGDAKDIVTQVRGIMDAWKGTGKGEGSSGTLTKEGLADKLLLQLVSGVANKKDPIEYLLDGIKVANASATGKKDPAEYILDGIKVANVNMANTIKLVTGKGNIGPSAEDIVTLIKREIQSATPPATTEHLPTEEEVKTKGE